MKVKLIVLILIAIFVFSFISCMTESEKTIASLEARREKQMSAETTYSIQTTTIIYESETKYGLNEIQRMQAFYDLIVLQDSITIGDSNRSEKLEEAYLIIAKKYGITKNEMEQIGIEGIEKNWPMP